MSIYKFNNEVISSDDPNIEAWLSKAHGDVTRPLCMCKADGIPMYIAKIGNSFVIKRMPNTGGTHHMSCESYETPPELSGLGQVEGSAIQENSEDGTTALKFNFALSKSPGKQVTKQAGNETDTVKTDGTKLTLRSTLHYLWEQAGFNRYTPAMQGKRSWNVIRKYLLQAAGDKLAKGQNLSSMLYIPEVFFLDKKDEISHRRVVAFNQIAAPEKGTRKLMIVIAEVKTISQSRYGYKVLFKHLPDCPFMFNEDLYKRLMKRFSNELELWDALENSHLMLVGTFGVSKNGIPTIEEAALMNVNSDWIPFENGFENTLLNTLTEGKRSFIKGLRYNMPSDKPMASVVLSDMEDTPMALYIFNPENENLVEQTNELIAQSDLNSWVWDIGDVMPALPSAIEQA